MREARLAERREGRKREGGRVPEPASERACCGCLVPCSGEGSVTGGRRRGCVVQEAGGGTLPPRMVAGGEGLLPAEGEEQKGSSSIALCSPPVSRRSSGGVALSVSVAFASWSRCHVPEASGTRLCRDRGTRSGEGGAGKIYPSSAEAKQRALYASCCFSRRHRQSPNLGETESSLVSARTRWCSRCSVRPRRFARCGSGGLPGHLSPVRALCNGSAAARSLVCEPRAGARREEQAPV
ncbi:uncharacterized protein LOC132087609 [Ammospiza nelsoni]|uniref:uncharacterized protein LOC132087609 n=1 Tax=Ammospiza nelsoni TaxID=2857394 RepID=UPI002869D963|nr:uncharacterized protein LOC132087609 [Ammospiza nelsoni]